MPILRTATGKEYYCNFMGVSSGYALFVRVRIDMEEALEIFRDPEETKVLQWIGTQGDVIREEKGFTKFTGFQLDSGPCPLRIRLEIDLNSLSND